VQETAQDFAQKTTQKFDLIVSNPPFFENSLKSPNTNRNIAKHTDTLPLSTLIQTIDILLSDTGQTGIILPFVAAEKFEILALNHHLYATKKTSIFPTPTKKPNRILMLFERAAKPCKEDSLVIRDNGYTGEYKGLVGEYLKI
jgi:tRNA1Val (adenine37-N6)-methyltransferase